MAESLFHKKGAAKPEPASPYELIEPEIFHLKKGYSVRYGPRGTRKRPLWFVVLGFCGLLYLYLMDPIEHAWYKGEAIKAYLYLHNYGAGRDGDELAGSGILSPDEVHALNQKTGAFQDYYPSPAAADREAQDIMAYMVSVKTLHSGRYENLDPVGRMRYLLFIRTGLLLPKSWDFLDPTVGG